MENNYERQLARLEEIATALEKGGLTLDESLTLFEEGVKLYAACNKQLEAARERMTTVAKNTGLEAWEEETNEL